MEAALAKVAEIQPQPAQASEQRRARRPRQQIEEVVRYFLAKEGSSIEKPELGVEVPSEGEALIKAFQSKNGVIYTVLAYKAEAEIQGGSPTLVKRPSASRATRSVRIQRGDKPEIRLMSPH